jgi:hypothetical protein
MVGAAVEGSRGMTGSTGDKTPVGALVGATVVNSGASVAAAAVVGMAVVGMAVVGMAVLLPTTGGVASPTLIEKEESIMSSNVFMLYTSRKTLCVCAWQGKGYERR